MTSFRTILLCTGLTLSLAACDRDAPVETADANPLLDYVPSETPYVAGDLQPIPDEVLDAWLVRVEPVLTEMQAQLSLARADLESAADPATNDPARNLVLALLREVDGKLSRPGLESLGLDLRAHRVVYGLGAFPVFRMGLADAATLRATIQRVLDGAGIAAPELEFQGARYWRVAGDDAAAEPLALYVAIRDDHLAGAVLPLMAETELLPQFLGLEKPANSDARARLAELNRSRGYTPHGSGVLDLHRLADDFLQAGGLAARTLAATENYDAGAVSSECAVEIHALIDNAPLMTMGTTELAADVIAYRYHLQTPPTLGSRLLDMVAEIPAVSPAADRVLEFAFGMRFGPVREFLREKAAAVVAQPYRCNRLQDLNESAANLLARLEQPMPPFVNNFRGLRAGIDDIQVGNDFVSSNARGHLAVHVEKPEMFVGMAQMFLPDLSALELRPGQAPVPLPESLLPLPGLVAFAAMSSDAIGLSVGAGEQETLVGFLEQEPAADGTFLSVSYDMATYLDYTGELGDLLEAGDREHGPGSDAAQAIANAARSAMRAAADRNLTTLRFTPEGLQVDARLSMKPLAEAR